MDTTTPNHYSLVVDDLRLELSGLETKEKELVEKIGQLRQAIAFIEERMAKIGSGKTDSKEDTDEGPYSDLSLIDAVLEYLGVVGRPADTRSIADALVRGGYKSKAKSLYNNVYGSLNREGEKASPRVIKKGTRWDLPRHEDYTDTLDAQDRSTLAATSEEAVEYG